MLSPSPAEPVSQLRRVKIVESGEEMTDFLALCPALAWDRPRFDYRRETLLRRTVAQKLCEAAERLPPSYRLAIIEGWRAPHIQRRMYQALWNQFRTRHPEWSDVTMRRVVNRFSAPMDSRVPPPHTTGGAVDLMLADADGQVLEHSAPYDRDDPASYPFAAPGLTPEARRHRDLLAEALVPVGVTNYPSEFWHWSYGDQGWAYRGGHPNAIYSAVTPPGWTPDPGDDIDAPLAYLQEDRAE